MTQKNILTDRIVQAFTKQQNVGYDKFRQVKRAVKAALKGVEPDTRFPTVRELAAALNMGTIPIQKALMELIAENLLYSRKRVGIFVKKQPERVKVLPVPIPDPLGIYAYEMDFHLRELLIRIKDEFTEKKNFGCGFLTDFYFEEPRNPSIYIQTSAPDPLNLAESIGLLPGRNPAYLCSPTTGIVTYLVFGFLWNRDLFARMGIPEPSFRDYASQKEYFRNLNSLFPDKIISSIYPDTFLYKNLCQALREDHFLQEKRKDFLMEDLRELISFSGLFHYFIEEKDRSSHLALFHQQKLPGILLNTNIYRNFRKEGLPFETGFYPLYDISGNFMLLPMTMQIQNRLETFYQSAQFFQFVQSENVQEFFAREEFVTLQGKFRGTADFCPEEKRSCIFTGDPYIKYMMGSVIRLELFCRAIQKKEPAEALENIFAYPRIIRNSFPEK